MRLQGKITRWDDEKGFGFVSSPGEGSSVFVHIKAFSQTPHRPEVGDVVSYEMAKDKNGRPRAERVRFLDQPKTKSPSIHQLQDNSLPVSFVAVLIFGLGIYFVVSAGLRWWTIIWFPLAVAEWFNLFSLIRWRTTIEFRRNPKFREEYHLTFSRDNVHFKTASLDSTLQWTHYERVIETPDLFLLMYGKGLYTLIPKRCLTSNEDINTFRSLLDQTIG